MSSWLTVPLVQKKYPCLLFLINFVMKSTLSYVEMGMPAYFLNPLDRNTFLPSFYSKAVLIFKVKMHFLETTERYCFLIHHSVNLCLLIEDLRLFNIQSFYWKGYVDCCCVVDFWCCGLSSTLYLSNYGVTFLSLFSLKYCFLNFL